MRRTVRIAGAGAVLSPLLVLSACPSLDEIAVGPRDAGSDLASSRPDAAGDARRDGGPPDAARDAPCTADVAADPKNCGACGHDCLGGACAAGACEPIELFSGDIPANIVAFGPMIYVSVQTGYAIPTGYVFRCDPTDCGKTTTVLAKGLGNPWFAAARDGVLYWGDYGTQASMGDVKSCAVTGCGDAGPSVLYAADAGPDGSANTTALTVDPTYVYWAETYTDTSTIFRCLATDCAGTVQQVASSFGITFGLAVDTSYVYWLQVGSNEILRCAHGSCAGSPEIFADILPGMNPLAVCGLTLYGGDVYWTAGIDGGAVYSCPTGKCTKPKTIAAGLAAPGAVAVDDSGVYWTNTNGGSVMRCPLAGCSTPTVLATIANPYAIALDEVSVYFTSGSLNGVGVTQPGRVLRVAK